MLLEILPRCYKQLLQLFRICMRYLHNAYRFQETIAEWKHEKLSSFMCYIEIIFFFNVHVHYFSFKE